MAENEFKGVGHLKLRGTGRRRSRMGAITVRYLRERVKKWAMESPKEWAKEWAKEQQTRTKLRRRRCP